MAKQTQAQAEHTPALSTESRWPMAAAVLSAMVLTILLPKELRPGPNGLAPGLEGLLLLALVVRDPGRISENSPTLRALSLCLVTLLVLAALFSTVSLVSELIHGGKLTNSADELLQAGASVWILTNIAFSLLYWELEAGGSAERLFHPRRFPDIAFPQDLNPTLAPAGWKPRFVDFLYLGFTNATAFSPTDAMPLVAWAKLAMALQAVLSLVILGLVVARAVNVFS
jgi:uncharacterized membrane protein